MRRTVLTRARKGTDEGPHVCVLGDNEGDEGKRGKDSQSESEDSEPDLGSRRHEGEGRTGLRGGSRNRKSRSESVEKEILWEGLDVDLWGTAGT